MDTTPLYMWHRAIMYMPGNQSVAAEQQGDQPELTFTLSCGLMEALKILLNILDRRASIHSVLKGLGEMSDGDVAFFVQISDSAGNF